MKISEILSSKKIGISCELFPPKLGSQLDNVKEVVKEMAEIKPSYMSITYGATGGTSEYTVDIAKGYYIVRIGDTVRKVSIR